MIRGGSDNGCILPPYYRSGANHPGCISIKSVTNFRLKKRKRKNVYTHPWGVSSPPLNGEDAFFSWSLSLFLSIRCYKAFFVVHRLIRFLVGVACYDFWSTFRNGKHFVLIPSCFCLPWYWFLVHTSNVCVYYKDAIRFLFCLVSQPIVRNVFKLIDRLPRLVCSLGTTLK